MNPGGRERSAILKSALEVYDRERQKMPGIRAATRLDTFVRQLLDSSRRTEYVATMLRRPLALARRDPFSPLFDPILGAIACMRSNDYEEACWLVFLATHFGKSKASGWGLCQAVYGRLGSGPVSTWDRTTRDTAELCSWISINADQIKNGPPRRTFGNHRKYESLVKRDTRGTPETIRTYVEWVQSAGSHTALIGNALEESQNDKYRAFDQLYKSMSVVASFGRLAKFDYLSMLGKIGLAPIAAGSTYLSSSTGPLAGAALLFTNSPTPTQAPRVLDAWLKDLGEALHVTMQDLEDALCNWQKSPDRYERFSG